MKIKRPIYMRRLIDSKDNGLIKIVTGLRRVGKSYLLKTLFKEHLLESSVPKSHILIIDLEDRRKKAFRDPDYLLNWVDSQMKDDEQYYIIIDEVQRVEEFVDMLGSLVEMPNADVYVTGSNSHFLSNDVATEFRGRGDEIHVWPLTFNEFMSAYDGDIVDGWQEYYTYGGLPKILSIKGDDKKAAYLRNLGSRRYYLQSAYRLPDEEKMQQEKRSLQQIGDSFKKIVVVGERMKLRRDESGIVMMGIYEFLSEPELLDA